MLGMLVVVVVVEMMALLGCSEIDRRQQQKVRASPALSCAPRFAFILCTRHYPACPQSHPCSSSCV